MHYQKYKKKRIYSSSFLPQQSCKEETFMKKYEKIQSWWITARRYSITQTGFRQEGSQDSWTTGQPIFWFVERQTLKLPSGEVRLISKNCLATVGQVRNVGVNQKNLGRAGSKCWLGKCPVVRGVVLNPLDHPHGGGERAIEDATGEDELTLQRQFPTQPWGQGSIYTRRQWWIPRPRHGRKWNTSKESKSKQTTHLESSLQEMWAECNNCHAWSSYC